MVPNEWIEDSIRSAALLITKGATPTTYGYDFVERSDASIRFVGAYNCSFDGYFKSDSEKWISIEADQMLKRSRLSLGDSIICIVGNTIGSSFLVDESVLPANINQNVAVIRPDGNVLNSVYLHFWIMSPYIQWQVLQEASTQAQPSLSLKQVGEFKILLPPLPEQKKIAQILSTWDKAITTTEQLLANSQQQKKALMQQLLTGKKRLLDKNGVRFSGDWNALNLGEILSKVSNGVTYDAKNVEGLPVTRIETISTGKVNFNKVGFAPDEENTRRFKLHQGDILYSHINSLEHIGRVAYFNDARPLYHGMNLLLLRTGEKHDSLYIYYLLGSELGKKYAKSYAKSAVNQASISTTDVKAFRFLIPNLPEQQKIAAVLSAADQEISALQQKLDALKQEKKALMQQLLTGKRRVKIDNKEVA